MKKEYKLSEDIFDMFAGVNGLEKLRDKYITMRFCHKKAVKTSQKIEQMKAKAWRMVYDLYPDLKGKTIQISVYKNTLEITEEK